MVILHKISYRGFALPTIMIAAVVTLAVLVVAVAAVSTTRLALSDQYYAQLAREAAESGLIKAQACLKQSNYLPEWTNAAPLMPNTDCSGVVVSGQSQFVMNADGTQASFSVPLPTTLASGVQRVTASGQANRVRTSNGAIWKSYSESLSATIGAQTTFKTVTFGYQNLDGAFFATIGPRGTVNALGFNGNGQLGNGTMTSASYVRPFQLPAGAYASALYSNFLSVGYDMFAVTTDGRLFGAGSNAYGQLGDGTTVASQPNPVQFQLPVGVKAKYVGVLRTNTFVIADDNNVYAAGGCADGLLGNNYTIAGCADKSSYVRVALPVPTTADPNTLPVPDTDWVQSTNLAEDRANVFVRMQGGRVYGWGTNNNGQLANGTKTSSSVPVKIGAFGDPGQSKATQLAFDGESLYVLDSNGDVYTAGWNAYGSLAGAMAPMSSSTGFCLDNPGNSTTAGPRIRIFTCNNSTAQKLEWQADGAIKFRPNATTELCIDNANGSAADGNPVRLWACNGTPAQQWQYRDDGSIYNAAVGKCIDNPGNSASSGTDTQLYQCNGTPAQDWSPEDLVTLSRVPIPASSGKVLRVTTDQYATLFLTEDGKIWGAGTNTRGELGNGQSKVASLALTQMILPVGKKAVDFYTTRAGGVGTQYVNSYAILDDGSIWGSGGNTFGQLGNGTVTTTEMTPKKMLLPVGVRAQAVQSGLGTTVILSDMGKIYTVGNNQYGQLGDGTTTNSATPRANTYLNVIPVNYY